MSRPFIETITSNLKSPDGEPWTAHLSQRTLIVGSNASHKSSILQAAELALTGAVDDIIWRSVVRDVALLITMAPGKVLESKITLSSGAIHQFRVEAGKRPPGPNFNNGVLPIRQVREAVAGSPSTARKIFLPWLAGDLSDSDLLAHIPTKLHGKFKDLLQHIGQGKSRAEALLRIEEYAGKQQHSASKEVKGAQSIIDELTSQMEEAPSEEDLAAAEVRLHDLLAQKPAPSESREVLEARLAEARDQFDTVEEIASKLEFEDCAVTILQSAMTHDLDQCPVCSSQVGIPHLEACLDHYTNLSESLENEHQLSFTEATHAMAIAQHKIAKYKGALMGFNELPQFSTTELDKAQAEYDDLKTTQVKWDTLTSAKRKIEQYEKDIETYKQLKAACSDVIATIVKDRAPAFCQLVSSFLPKGWEFNLTDKDFRPGLLRNDEVHSALCGAEGAAVLTAIAMATAASRPASEPVILIPEDRAFDPRTLAAVMRGYNKFDGQVIMASTVRPRGRPSKHWTIIDLDTEPLAVVEAAPEPESEPETEATPEPEPVPEPVAEPALAARTILRKDTAAITGRNLRILKGLGYDDDAISQLTPKQADEIVKAGHLAANVEISNGAVTVRNTTLPSLPPPPR